MIKRRPWRAVSGIVVGAGCDTLLLDCGHEVVVNHTSKPRKRAQCYICPYGIDV